MQYNEKMTIEKFKKLPLKQKFYYITCLAIGIIILPFYYAYIGFKKLFNIIKEKIQNGRRNKINN